MTSARNANEEYRLLSRIAEAASDWALAAHDPEFAELCGGVEKLQAHLFDCVVSYENWSRANAGE